MNVRITSPAGVGLAGWSVNGVVTNTNGDAEISPSDTITVSKTGNQTQTVAGDFSEVTSIEWAQNVAEPSDDGGGVIDEEATDTKR